MFFTFCFPSSRRSARRFGPASFSSGVKKSLFARTSDRHAIRPITSGPRTDPDRISSPLTVPVRTFLAYFRHSFPCGFSPHTGKPSFFPTSRSENRTTTTTVCSAATVNGVRDNVLARYYYSFYLYDREYGARPYFRARGRKKRAAEKPVTTMTSRRCAGGVTLRRCRFAAASTDQPVSGIVYANGARVVVRRYAVSTRTTVRP